MTGYELEIGENKNPESDDITVRYVDDGECAALFLSDGSYTDNRRATELAQELINVHNAKLKIGERKIEIIEAEHDVTWKETD